MWLVPPTMNSQMTLLALAVKCGLPSGGDQRAGASARATPSLNSMAPRARPVKPMPTSARKERRDTPPQQETPGIKVGELMDLLPCLANRDKLIVIHQDLNEVFPRPHAGIGGRRDRSRWAGAKGCQFLRVGEQARL